MTVTFIYKLYNENTVYFGKYIATVTDDYNVSLDHEIKSLIYPILKIEYKNLEKSDLQVGILFNLRQDYDYYSENEKNVFNLWYYESRKETKIFLDGVQIDQNDIHYEYSDYDDYDTTETEEENENTEEEATEEEQIDDTEEETINKILEVD